MHPQAANGALIDGGANGGVIGTDAQMLEYVDFSGPIEAKIDKLPLVRAALGSIQFRMDQLSSSWASMIPIHLQNGFPCIVMQPAMDKDFEELPTVFVTSDLK